MATKRVNPAARARMTAKVREYTNVDTEGMDPEMADTITRESARRAAFGAAGRAVTAKKPDYVGDAVKALTGFFHGKQKKKK